MNDDYEELSPKEKHSMKLDRMKKEACIKENAETMSKYMEEKRQRKHMTFVLCQYTPPTKPEEQQ